MLTEYKRTGAFKYTDVRNTVCNDCHHWLLYTTVGLPENERETLFFVTLATFPMTSTN